MSDKRNKNLISLMFIVVLITSLLGITYGYIYTKTSNNGTVLIIESVVFLFFQLTVFLVLKIKRILSTERILRLYVGLSGIGNSVFLELLVSQRVSKNFETMIFVLFVFAAFDLFFILMWKIIYKKNNVKHIKSSRKNKIIPALSFVGAILGVIIVRFSNYYIVVFDILVSLLSFTYTFFVLFFEDNKTEDRSKPLKNSD